MGPTFESTIQVCAIDDSIFFSGDSLPHLPDVLTLTDVDRRERHTDTPTTFRSCQSTSAASVWHVRSPACLPTRPFSHARLRTHSSDLWR
jgi:hypothetical protein